MRNDLRKSFYNIGYFLVLFKNMICLNYTEVDIL